MPALERAGGRVGFQIHLGVIQLRHIEIRELPADSVGVQHDDPLIPQTPGDATAVDVTMESTGAGQKLNDAKITYRQNWNAFRKTVTALFAERENELQKGGDATLIEQLQRERNAFDQRGDIPNWVSASPILKFVDDRNVMNSAYDAAIKELVAAKRDDLVSLIRRDRAAFSFRRFILLAYHHEAKTISGRLFGKREIQLFSDGWLEAPSKGGTTIDRIPYRLTKQVLTIRWPNSKAPGGAFVDTLHLSNDGLSYKGTNQLKDCKLSGTRITN
jgi:hypothetical protein